MKQKTIVTGYHTIGLTPECFDMIDKGTYIMLLPLSSTYDNTSFIFKTREEMKEFMQKKYINLKMFNVNYKEVEQWN